MILWYNQREVKSTRELAQTNIGWAWLMADCKSMKVEAARRVPYRRPMLGAAKLLFNVYTSCWGGRLRCNVPHRRRSTNFQYPVPMHQTSSLPYFSLGTTSVPYNYQPAQISRDSWIISMYGTILHRTIILQSRNCRYLTVISHPRQDFACHRSSCISKLVARNLYDSLHRSS